jgi:transcriptional regulator with XRE-family HTH domain
MTELAALCDCSVSLISEIIGGTRNATPRMLPKLADALGCPKAQLRRKPTRKPEPEPQPEPMAGL